MDLLDDCWVVIGFLHDENLWNVCFWISYLFEDLCGYPDEYFRIMPG